MAEVTKPASEEQPKESLLPMSSATTPSRSGSSTPAPLPLRRASVLRIVPSATDPKNVPTFCASPALRLVTAAELANASEKEGSPEDTDFGGVALSPEQTYRPASDAYGEGGQNGNLNPLSVTEQTTDDDDDDVTPTAVKATGKAWTRSMGLDGSSSFDGNSGSDSIHSWASSSGAESYQTATRDFAPNFPVFVPPRRVPEAAPIIRSADATCSRASELEVGPGFVSATASANGQRHVKDFQILSETGTCGLEARNGVSTKRLMGDVNCTDCAIQPGYILHACQHTVCAGHMFQYDDKYGTSLENAVCDACDYGLESTRILAVEELKTGKVVAKLAGFKRHTGPCSRQSPDGTRKPTPVLIARNELDELDRLASPRLLIDPREQDRAMPTLQSAYSMPNFGIDSKGIQALSHESDYDEAEPSLDENPSSKFSTHPDEHPSKSALIGSAHNDGSHYSAVGSSSKVPASEAPFDGVLKRFRARELAEAIKSRSLSEVKTGNNPSQHTLGEGRPLRNKGDEFSALVPFHRMPDGSVARNPGPEVLAWLPRNGPPKLEELISRLPFAEKCSLSKPSDHGIVKICGMPWKTAKTELFATFGQNSSLASASPQSPFFVVHFLMDRASGRTLDPYIELDSPEKASSLVSMAERKATTGYPFRIGKRTIDVQLSSHAQLMADLFPKAKCVEWNGQTPVVRPPRDPWESRFKGFINQEELLWVSRYAEWPTQFLIQNRTRPFESMIATLRKYPWFATDLFTVQERDLLFDTTLSLVCTLANNLRRPDCHKLLTPTLLQELVHAGLDAPGFSESQRARVLAAAGGPNTIPNAAPPHPLALNCPLRVLTLHGADTLTSFYLHCIKRAANHLVITASKGNISDAVQKSANSPFGCFHVPWPTSGANQLTLAEAAQHERNYIISLLKHYIDALAPRGSHNPFDDPFSDF